MASSPLSLPLSFSYCRPPITFKFDKRGCSFRRASLNQKPPHRLGRLKHSFFPPNDKFFMAFPEFVNREHAKTTVEILDALKRVIPTAVGVNLLTVTPPADALPSNLPFDLPDNWLEIFFIVASFGFIYLLVVPLLLYYYLEQRWFKRKMAEAILQFGLVFLFFPGMLLLAPFINFRSLPQDGAKEPWDEIQP